MNTSKNYYYSARIILWGVTILALPAAFADTATMFKLLDTDGDGRLSRAEYMAGAQQMFTTLDTNGDGIITVAEMEAGRDLKKKNKHHFWDKKDEKSTDEKIPMVRTNSDGQLTRAENDAGTESLFAAMDTDNDGYLSKGECEACHQLLKKDK